MTIVGSLMGIGVTIAIYPHILQRRAKRMLAACSSDGNRLGDPVGNYLALLMLQLRRAYGHLNGEHTLESKHEMENILAGYCSFLTINGHRSECEQFTLDAIHRACGESETLRQAVDRELAAIKDKTPEQIIEETVNTVS